MAADWVHPDWVIGTVLFDCCCMAVNGGDGGEALVLHEKSC